MGTTNIKQWFRYVAAVAVSPFIGEIVGFPVALILDVLWGQEVTGGQWALTFPNVFLVVIKALVTGFAAGWIARRRGKIVATLANFFFLEAVLIISIVLNRDLVGAISTATKPALWVWIGLIPALLAGHLAVKYKHLGFAPVLMVVGTAMSFVLSIGALAFHLYTVITAYELNGFLGAMIAFIAPIASELWYSGKIWKLSGTFWNIYTLRFVLLIVWGILTMVIWTVATYLEEKKQSTVAFGS